MNEDKKYVKIPVWDLETDEIIEMEIEQEALDAMDKASKEQEDRIEESLKEDSEARFYASLRDYDD